MVMDNVCFLYYHEKEDRLQNYLPRGQPPLSKPGKWPILPHLGGVKWVTHYFLNKSSNILSQVIRSNLLVKEE